MNIHVAFKQLDSSDQLKQYAEKRLAKLSKFIPNDDNVEIFEKNKRSGKIDRIKVSSAIEDFGALSSLDLLFESDVLLKTNCNNNKAIISEIWN